MKNPALTSTHKTPTYHTESNHQEKRSLLSEQRLLRFSAYGAIAFALSGIILGTITGSQMILFDGLYSLISVVLSFFSLAASKFMAKKDRHAFPFGKDTVEPLVILIQYLILLVLVSGSFLSAFSSLLTGGRTIELNAALAYSLIGSLACLGVYLYLRVKGKGASGLVGAEKDQWFIDTLVSLAVFIGFVLSALLKDHPAFGSLVPYIDPLMVMMVSAFFLKTPLGQMKASLREILEMRPKGNLPMKIEKHVKDLEEKYDMRESKVRVAKVGKTLWVEIRFVLRPESKIKTIDDQDRLREEIARYIKPIQFKKSLSVSFTKNRKWAV